MSADAPSGGLARSGTTDGGRAPVLNLVNLTAHEVVLDPGGPGAPAPLRIPASGVVPRIKLSEGVRTVMRVKDPADPGGDSPPVEVPLMAEATWLCPDPPLPEPQTGTVYITSRTVAEHFPERTDLVWPDDLVRDAEGRVVAARRLACLEGGLDPGDCDGDCALPGGNPEREEQR